MYITIGLLVLFGLLYGYFREKAGKRALIFKAAATSMAVLAGIYGALQTHRLAEIHLADIRRNISVCLSYLP